MCVCVWEEGGGSASVCLVCVGGCLCQCVPCVCVYVPCLCVCVSKAEDRFVSMLHTVSLSLSVGTGGLPVCVVVCAYMCICPAVCVYVCTCL